MEAGLTAGGFSLTLPSELLLIIHLLLDLVDYVMDEVILNESLPTETVIEYITGYMPVMKQIFIFRATY